MLGWYFSKGRGDLCIALDYLPLGDLQTFVATHGPLAEQDSQQIIGQVLHGLDIMHEAGFAHRDVKPQVQPAIFQSHRSTSDDAIEYSNTAIPIIRQRLIGRHLVLVDQTGRLWHQQERRRDDHGSQHRLANVHGSRALLPAYGISQNRSQTRGCVVGRRDGLLPADQANIPRGEGFIN
jgi:hypothetical protein